MGKKSRRKEVRWLPQPEEHNYPAADSYLNLVRDPKTARALVKALRAAPLTRFKAKDIFRASGLNLLGISNSHVEKDRDKIKEGTPLSPLLLVRDVPHSRVIIADGYHRLCALYTFDEDAWIHCKIV